MRRSVKPAGGALIVSLLLSQSALGGRLELEPIAAVSIRYSDNPTLIPEESNPESAMSSLTDFSLAISQQSADTSLSVNPKIRRIEYFESKFDDLSENEYFLDGQIIKTLELLTIGTDFRFSNQTVLTAEDDPDFGASGNLLRVDDRVERLTASPFVIWNRSASDQLTFSGQVARVDQIKRLSPRADYNTLFGSINYQRALDERHFVGFETTASRTNSVKKTEFCARFGFQNLFFERDVCLGLTGPPPDFAPGKQFISTLTTEQDFETFSGGLTYEYAASENLNVKARYGLQKTNIEQFQKEIIPGFDIIDTASTDSDFTSSTYLFAATYTQPKTDWEFELTRDVQPTSAGDPADKEQAQASITHRLTRRWTAIFDVLYWRQTQRTTTISSKDNYLKANINLNRRMNQNLTLGVTYIYRNRDPQLDSVNPITVANANLNRISHSVIAVARYKF